MANDLSMLLKTDKIELEAGLDIAKTLDNIRDDLGSINRTVQSDKKYNIQLVAKISTDIREISKDITAIQTQINKSDSLKTVKLKVSLDANISDLKRDLKALQTKIADSKSIEPIKLSVQIDAKGSATVIKNQLNEISSSIAKFKSDYGKVLEDAGNVAQRGFEGLKPTQKTALSIQDSISDIKSQITKEFGDGIFSTKLISDADGNAQRLVATLERAGEQIKSVTYAWNDDIGGFDPISQTDVDRLENNTAKAKVALESLRTSIEQLDNNDNRISLQVELENLKTAENLTMDSVKALKLKVAEEKNLQLEMKNGSAVLLRQKEIQEQIQNVLKSSRGLMAGNKDALLEILDKSESEQSLVALKEMKRQVSEITTQEKEHNNFIIKKIDLQTRLSAQMQKLADIQIKMTKNAKTEESMSMAVGYTSDAQEIVRQAKSIDDLRKAEENLIAVRNNVNQISNETRINKENQLIEKQTSRVRLLIEQLEKIGYIDASQVTKEFQRLDREVEKGSESIREMGNELQTALNEAKSEAKSLNQSITLISSSTDDLAKNSKKVDFGNAINAGDTDALQRYVGELKNGKVETLSMTNTTDEFGRAVTRMKVNMDGAGKTVKQYTIDVIKARDGSVSAVQQISSASTYNANRNLGVFEQLKVAMARVPVWMTAMTAFYAVVRGGSYVTGELLEINSAMIELQRVAGDDINVDSMLSSSVVQAKELGSNLHEILASLGEATRTFGEFNEQALLAINSTAVIMDNVSDLSLEESMSSLIGTMNAFGVSAEDSMHIVDSFNEVDNNFAISTQQIATAMSRTGATAKTFGVELEEVVGQVTAIGSVTMESGEKIGNSLKSIYSRITTMDESRDILDSVGVAIRSIGESGETEIRPVTDILSDLALVWNDLSDSQRQNIGVTIAGRNQLSRFLALMNNWDTAVDATTTAYNSQGSALKEQAEYMDSYEAKINQLKTRFTELAMTIGEVFLSDAMFEGLEIVGDITEGVTKLVDKVGVLPAMFSIIGGAVKLFDIPEKVAKLKIFDSISTSFNSAKIAISGTSTAMATATGVMGKAGAVATGLGAGFKAMALSTGGIMLLATALGWVIEKVIKLRAEEKAEQENFDEIRKNAVETYNQYGNSMDSVIDRYDVLNKKFRENKDSMSSEELNEYTSLTQKLADIMPNVIDYVDENGEAHLKSTQAIKEEAEWVKKLSVENEKLVATNISENIDKQVESYTALADKYADLAMEKQKYENIKNNEQNPNSGLVTADRMSETVQAERLHDIETKRVLTEYELNSLLNDNVDVLQQNTRQLMTANGEMENMTDSSKNIVDNFINVNKNKINVNPDDFETAEEASEALKENMEDLSNDALIIGETVNSIYADMTEGLEGAELEDVTQQLDALVNVIPDDFLMMGDKSSDPSSVAGNLKAILGVADQIQAGSGDIQGFVDILVNLGVSTNDAREMVKDMGTTFENQAIQTAIAQEELETYNEDLADTADLAFEAIDPLEQLFGLQSGDISAMKSNISYLALMRDEMGNLIDTPATDSATQSLAKFLNVPKQYVKDNIDLLQEQAFQLDQMKVDYDESGHAYLTFGETVDAEGNKIAITQSNLADALMNGMIATGDFAGAYGMMTGVVGRATEEMHTSLKDAFAEFQADPDEWMPYFTTVKEQLNELDGDITTFRDSNGKLRLMMSDGSQSAYLDTLNEQLGLMNIEVALSEDGTQLLFETMDSGAKVVSSLSDEAKNGTKAIAGLNDAYSLFKDNNNEETESAYINKLKEQLWAFGEDVVLAGDATSGFKLEMADGSTSAWLDTLNGQIDGTNLKFVDVDESQEGVRMALQTANGNYVYFDEIIGQGGNSADAVNNVITKTEELDKILNEGAGPRKVEVDAQPANDDVQSLIDKINIANTLGIAPTVSPTFNSELANAENKLDTTQAKLTTVLDNSEKVVSAVSSVSGSMDTIMNNSVALGGVAGSASTLKDKLVEARGELGLLFAETGSDSVDTSGIDSINTRVTTLKTDIQATMSSINTSLSMASVINYVSGVATNLAVSNGHYTAHANSVAQSLSAVTNIHSASASNTMAIVSRLSSSMVNMFNTAYQNIVNKTGQLRNTLASQFQNIDTNTTGQVNNIARNMSTIFRSGADDIVKTASSLPARIGQGIRDNMASASSSMSALADNMVTRFKQALGIHSPSRVFTELGGFVIQGLVNGLSNGNLTDLGQNVFDDFGGGVLSSMDMMKSYLSGSFSGVAGAGVQQWTGLATKALQMTGQFSESNLQKLLYQMQTESGGNAQAINLWDSNAKAGIPSKGLMQVIDPTFQAYAMQGYNSNIYDPLSNILASIRYAMSRYGSLANAYRGVGYANGGFVDSPELAWHGEEGLEAIIPLIPKRRKRGLDLWTQAGEKLGVNEKLLKLMARTSGAGSSNTSSYSMASEGGAEGSSSEGSAGTGILHTSTTDIVRAIDPTFQTTADGDLADLYEIDYLGRSLDISKMKISRATAELEILVEKSTDYRNVLTDINYQEAEMVKIMYQQIDGWKNEHKYIINRLQELSDVNSQTKEQRDEYNFLQKRFEEVTKYIHETETSIVETQTSIANRTKDIFQNYLDEILTNYEKALTETSRLIDNVDFDLDKLAITDSENVVDKMGLMAKKISYLISQETTIKNKQQDLLDAYNQAVTEYGANTDVALLAKENLLEVEEELEDATLELIKLEKELEDSRRDVAENSIDNLKEYYENVKDMSTSAIELEKEQLEKLHEDKLSMYDEEIDKINSIYDAKIDSLNAEKEEEDYLQTLNKKNKERIDLMNQISLASRDTSLEGKKELANLQSKLTELNTEITTIQEERQEKLYKDAIEEQRKQQISAVESQKETEESKYKTQQEALDKQISETEKKYDSIIGDNATWDKIKNDFVSGESGALNNLMLAMQTQLAQLMSGNYSSINGFENLSDSDKAKFAEENMLDINNMMFEFGKNLSTINDLIGKTPSIPTQGSSNFTNSDLTTWYGQIFASPVSTVAGQGIQEYNPYQSYTPKNRVHTVRAGDTLWDLAREYYGDGDKWSTILDANNGLDPTELRVGRQLIVPFDTGGYTGSWFGTDGKIAMLHKKELVLNEQQTQDILNTAKLIDGLKSMIPKTFAKGFVPASTSSGTSGVVIEEMTFNFPDFKGTKENAKTMFDVFVTELKKR